jgi:NAD-dependent SIR2 family protein deacetylase
MLTCIDCYDEFAPYAVDAAEEQRVPVCPRCDAFQTYSDLFKDAHGMRPRVYPLPAVEVIRGWISNLKERAM